jgi:hypothetical protein
MGERYTQIILGIKQSAVEIGEGPGLSDYNDKVCGLLDVLGARGLETVPFVDHDSVVKVVTSYESELGGEPWVGLLLDIASYGETVPINDAFQRQRAGAWDTFKRMAAAQNITINALPIVFVAVDE